MGDWLGTGRIADQDKIFRSFGQARDYVRSLNLKSRSEWNQFCKTAGLPTDIPATPERVYKKQGWKGMGDWLGTGRIAEQHRKYKTYKVAKEFANSLKLKSVKEWREYIRTHDLPDDIPAGPDGTYKGSGWVSWGEWLGTGRQADRHRSFRPFPAARNFSHSLQLPNLRSWQEYAKSKQRPADIPSHPDRTYKKVGWSGWKDWLGND